MDYVLDIIGVPRVGLKRAAAPLASFGRHVKDHFIPHARNNYHPHILGHRALGLFSALLVAVKIFTIAVLAWGPVAPAYSEAITEANIINLTNLSRQQSGEKPLDENSLLDQAAQAKANDMLARGYFAHDTPDGRTPWSFITAAGYNYLEAGENLAVNFTAAEDVETAWMNSPGHRANLLNKDFQDIGIGISQGNYQGHNAIFVVQEFGTPAAQQIALSSQPTAVQTAPVPAPAPAAPAAQPAPTAVEGANTAPSAIAASSAAGQYQTLAGSSASAAPPSSSGVNIENGQVKLDGDNVNITATVSGAAVKVLAYFGQQAIMLTAAGQGTWTGSVPVSSLAGSPTTVRLQATDMSGQSASLQLADFSPTTQANYSPLSPPAPSYVTWFGHTFEPWAMQQSFYLLFIAIILTSLVIAIGLKRHIQHLPLIANTAFVVILAVMIWRGG